MDTTTDRLTAGLLEHFVDTDDRLTAGLLEHIVDTADRLTAGLLEHILSTAFAIDPTAALCVVFAWRLTVYSGHS